MPEILFTAGMNPLSFIIRVLTRSQVSHVAIKLELGGVEMISEAGLQGVRLRSYARWAEENRVVARFKAPVKDYAITRALLAMDERYDVVGLLGYLPVLLGRSLGLLWRNPWASPRATVCSEYATEFLAGVPGFASLDPEATTPQDLLDLCLRHLTEVT